ncbi:hypothetical protein GCM10010922_02650 [Microbacterium sorbitolivorans]|uniref:DNA-3-methyladenine glycosylase 2 family protein n=1 Tax=Microbacterium sorbitolivorans TaxID=1867410 RepID=A0A367Y936_9MICO|nr:AlkA N-terminal domain-containing protein [Microbacterium sorbitolivorans]RCK61562.1 DNA-3-methyladenine glycosylase 2 family protein [Microbacterium sorbitolivorans]GGF31083.1 hypothetical protein GCM10010922_02650 [Microbacterium sorbitolivorans]
MVDVLEAVTLALPYRPPLNFHHLLRFYRARAVAGVEHVDEASYTRTLSLPHGPAIATVRDGDGSVSLELRHAHADDVPVAVARVRKMLGLDVDSSVIDGALGVHPALAAAVRADPGIRLPGSVDPHETVFRAIVGQQITVKSATSMLAGMAAAMPALGFEGPVNRLFPSAAVMAGDGQRAFRGPESRRRSLRLVAEALERDPALIDPGAGEDAVYAALLAFPGIGPWTASYATMRILGSPDVLLPNDSAVRAGAKALGIGEQLDAIADLVRPWRTFLTLHLWNAAA